MTRTTNYISIIDVTIAATALPALNNRQMNF